MSKVYIVNVAGHDFDAAEKFGELVAVTKGNINVFRPDRDLFNIQEKLLDFNHEEDYLLLTGNVLANTLSVSTLIFLGAESIKLLVYDAKNQDYINHNLFFDKRKRTLKFKRLKEKV